jgi:hypothetical protein
VSHKLFLVFISIKWGREDGDLRRLVIILVDCDGEYVSLIPLCCSSFPDDFLRSESLFLDEWSGCVRLFYFCSLFFPVFPGQLISLGFVLLLSSAPRSKTVACSWLHRGQFLSWAASRHAGPWVCRQRSQASVSVFDFPAESLPVWRSKRRCPRSLVPFLVQSQSFLFPLSAFSRFAVSAACCLAPARVPFKPLIFFSEFFDFCSWCVWFVAGSFPSHTLESPD